MHLILLIGIFLQPEPETRTFGLKHCTGALLRRLCAIEEFELESMGIYGNLWESMGIYGN